MGGFKGVSDHFEIMSGGCVGFVGKGIHLFREFWEIYWF